MLSRIHDVPVDLRTSNDADIEDDTFTMVRDRNKTTPTIMHTGHYSFCGLLPGDNRVISSQHMGSRAESGKSKGFSCTWDSLRNSAGEKILQLRSHPLGMPSDSNFCSLLSDLSVEQRFDVSYLDLGEFIKSSGDWHHSTSAGWKSLAICRLSHLVYNTCTNWGLGSVTGSFWRQYSQLHTV